MVDLYGYDVSQEVYDAWDKSGKYYLDFLVSNTDYFKPKEYVIKEKVEIKEEVKPVDFSIQPILDAALKPGNFLENAVYEIAYAKDVEETVGRGGGFTVQPISSQGPLISIGPIVSQGISDALSGVGAGAESAGEGAQAAGTGIGVGAAAAGIGAGTAGVASGLGMAVFAIGALFLLNKGINRVIG